MIKDNQKLLNILHIVTDGLIIIFSYIMAYYLRFDDTSSFLIKYEIIDPPYGYFKDIWTYCDMLVFLVPCYLLMYYLCNLYNPKRTRGRRIELFELIKANFLGVIFLMALFYTIKDIDYARLFLVIFVVLNIILDFMFRMIVNRILHIIRKSGHNLKHVVLVGYGRTAENYIDRLRAHPEWGYYVHGIMDDNLPEDFDYRNVKYMGRINELEKLLATNKYDEIAITLSIEEYAKLEKIVMICEKSGVHTKFVPDYNNVIPTKPYTEDLDGIPVIHVRHVPLTSSFNKVIKRIVDVFGAIVALIVFSIPMLLTAIAVKATSKGPLIFKQTRVGLHNKEFAMYKFRSMEVQEASEEKTAWTTKGDARVTPVGKFIRKTSIDELPQLFNVLKGDMSLVGPRPERPFFVQKFKEEIPRYMIKHQVRPGMTGWAQVNGYRGDTSIPKRIDYDLYYVENWTLLLDIKILFMTFCVGFVNKNAY